MATHRFITEEELGAFLQLPIPAGIEDRRTEKRNMRTIIAYAGKQGELHCWAYRCDCGRLGIATIRDLGRLLSCGCASSRLTLRERATTHGCSGGRNYALRTREHKIWSSMLSRCRNPRNPAYHNYGGRGIKVCERWQGEHGFENFLADVGLSPPGHQIDRIDNNGNYEPGNIRWVTAEENCRNTRQNRLVTLDGITKPLIEWCGIKRLPYSAVHARLAKGWTEERALSAPLRPQRNRKAKVYGLIPRRELCQK